MLSALWEHFGQLCCMALIIFGSQGITRRVQHRRTRAEVQRLRGALHLVLQALRAVHERNLDVLQGARPSLMSGRHYLTLLRTQLNKLLTLEQPEVESVLAANIAAEAAEAVMAIGGKSLSGVAFSVPKEEEEKAMLAASLRHACASIAAAEAQLMPSKMSSASAETGDRAALSRTAASEQPELLRS